MIRQNSIQGQLLNQPGAGASVCCVGPSAESLEPLIREIKEKFNTPSLALTADLLQPGAPEQVIQLIEKHCGPVDILINVTPSGYLRPFTEEPSVTQDWWPTMEAGLRVPVALTHAVLPSMIARGTGAIMSTTSPTGVISFPFLSAGAVASASLIKFHQQLHLEVSKKGITSFAVNPGPVPSYIHDPSRAFAEQQESIGMDPEFRGILAEMGGSMEWCAAGLAAGTFLALAAEGRTRVLSGLYVNAERDLEELLGKLEADRGSKLRHERLYVLKVDEL